jgi:ceramide glucosyltransferase
VIWLALPAVAAAAYYLLAIVAALRWGRPFGRTFGQAASPLPISILKPVYGHDPHFYEAIRSHAEQDYPEFEVLFGVSDPKDAALADIERLRREFPERVAGVWVVSTNAPNTKVGVLAELARHARHPVLLVSDSDITLGPGTFRAAAAPLAAEDVGLVTCLYRAKGDSWPSRMEALGIATEFAPGVLVARLLGIGEFALGAAMVFRAGDLRRIGGFEAIADFIADDYQLGARMAALGSRIEFAPEVVETDLGAQTWRQVWRHQLRWSRTIRVSRPGGYYGYAVTHATVWALMAFAAGVWWAGAAALATRLAAGVLVGWRVLKDRSVPALGWLIPLRDLFGFAVWLAGLLGDRVTWRGLELKLRRDGRIDSSPL